MDEERETLVPFANDSSLFSHRTQLASTLSSPMETIGSARTRQMHGREPSYASLEHSDNEHGVPAYSPASGSEARKAATAEQWSEKGHPPDRTGKSGRRRRPHFLLNWWQEMLACVVSLAALLALFATLYVYKNRPSPDWPDWISLNTIVAIYIVLLKSGILLIAAEGIAQLKWTWFEKGERPLEDLVKYDHASRGPVGAGALLWRLRARHLLASCGALITILALAADPFAQQIIRYHECFVPAPGPPVVLPRTNYYKERGGFHTGADLEQIVPGVTSALNAGVFSSISPPSTDCTTGNCTWASEYSSIGYCSACEDITNQLVFKNQTFHTHYKDGNKTDTFNTWNFTTLLPGGLACMTTNDFEDVYVGSGLYAYAAMGQSPLKVIESPPQMKTGPFPVSIDFVLAKDYLGIMNPSTGKPWDDCNSAVANQTWKCRGYGASRCWLSPCVKTFAASMQAGVLRETLLSSSYSFQTSSGPYSTELPITHASLDTQCLNAHERHAVEGLGYKIKPDKRWLAFNISKTPKLQLLKRPNPKAGFPESMASRGCLYAIDETFVVSLSEFLPYFFTGNVSGPAAVFYDEQIGDFSGPQVAQAVFNFGDVSFGRVSELFANVTDSLTNYIRQNGDDNFSAPAIGIARQEKACIAVRWPWLLFPVALVLLTLIFFTLMVLETRPTGNRPEIWKSSPLALLYHGLDSPISKDGRDIRHMHEMQALAKSTTVQLDTARDNIARLQVQQSHDV